MKYKTLKVDDMDTLSVHVMLEVGMLIKAPNDQEVFLSSAMLEKIVEEYRRQTKASLEMPKEWIEP